MNTTPTLDELRDLHKRCTYPIIQALFKGTPSPYGWWLYSKDGNPGTYPLTEADLMSIFVEREDTPIGAVTAMAALVRSYLVAGGVMRSVVAAQGSPLPRAIILIAPPGKLVQGEVVKTFVLTEHQVFLAESPVEERGNAVRLGDLELLEASLTHNRRPEQMN